MTRYFYHKTEIIHNFYTVFPSLVDILRLLFVILSELILLHFFYNLKVCIMQFPLKAYLRTSVIMIHYRKDDTLSVM